MIPRLVCYEHIYWDQGSLLAQVGLVDSTKLPVTGAEQARRLLDPKLPSNGLIHRAETLSRTFRRVFN
jgi:carboxymethylenebutenolidase